MPILQNYLQIKKALSITDNKVIDTLLAYGYIFTQEYLTIVSTQGEEEGEFYLSSLRQKIFSLTSTRPNTELRKEENYQELLKYVYQKGDYGDHTSNLRGGDKLQDIAQYKFNKDGYHTNLQKNE